MASGPGLDGARDSLAAREQQLAAATNTIEQQRTQLSANQTEIADLDTCLSGIARFFVQGGNNDEAGAEQTMNRIDAVCNAAYSGLPNH